MLSFLIFSSLLRTFRLTFKKVGEFDNNNKRKLRRYKFKEEAKSRKFD